jgi:hypothetical protein
VSQPRRATPAHGAGAHVGGRCWSGRATPRVARPRAPRGSCSPCLTEALYSSIRRLPSVSASSDSRRSSLTALSASFSSPPYARQQAHHADTHSGRPPGVCSEEGSSGLSSRQAVALVLRDFRFGSHSPTLPACGRSSKRSRTQTGAEGRAPSHVARCMSSANRGHLTSTYWLHAGSTTQSSEAPTSPLTCVVPTGNCSLHLAGMMHSRACPPLAHHHGVVFFGPLSSQRDGMYIDPQPHFARRRGAENHTCSCKVPGQRIGPLHVSASLTSQADAHRRSSDRPV